MTQYICLLRGINVGGNKKVEMKKLKELFNSLNYKEVITYLNTGNISFKSDKDKEKIEKEIKTSLEKTFGFEISTLIKTKDEIIKIEKSIPKEWENNKDEKTDVAYLFPNIDSKNIINILPIKKEFINIKYTKGVIIWNVQRKSYNKSRLNKIISCKVYKELTIRNVNTARFLAKK